MLLLFASKTKKFLAALQLVINIVNQHKFQVCTRILPDPIRKFCCCTKWTVTTADTVFSLLATLMTFDYAVPWFGLAQFSLAFVFKYNSILHNQMLYSIKKSYFSFGTYGT